MKRDLQKTARCHGVAAHLYWLQQHPPRLSKKRTPAGYLFLVPREGASELELCYRRPVEGIAAGLDKVSAKTMALLSEVHS